LADRFVPKINSQIRISVNRELDSLSIESSFPDLVVFPNSKEITLSAKILNHPGFFSTIYAEPLQRQNVQATIIWGDFRRSTRVCVLWQNQRQPVPGQREIEIDGRMYRLRWLPPQFL